MTQIPPNSIPDLMDALRQGAIHLTAMAKKLEQPFDPSTEDPRRLHNMYARNLVTCYVSKFAELSDGILDSIKDERFMVYALCGRALIETTATLRYYMFEKYKPLLDRAASGLTIEDCRQLVAIDEQHLRGSRFDWDSFLLRNYQGLRDDALAGAEAKKRRRPSPAEEKLGNLWQVNASTCVENWAKQEPGVTVAYGLFCDLVHPNVGSNFLVASTSTEGLHFSRFRGSLVGRDIFEQSFPFLLSTAHKPFGPLLMMLAGTIWPEDQL